MLAYACDARQTGHAHTHTYTQTECSTLSSAHKLRCKLTQAVRASAAVAQKGHFEPF